MKKNLTARWNSRYWWKDSWLNQNQERKGLKILTPDQILSRLLIFFSSIKAINNSEKLENEIR